MNSIKTTARIAGFLYLVLAPLALFGMMYVPTLIVPGDAATTASNVMASESLIRLSIASSLVVQVGHIFLVLLLYKVLKPVSENHALLMVIFLLVGVPIAMLAEVGQYAVLLLAGGADYFTALGADQLHDLVLLFRDMREHGVFIAQVFWGLWLFPMGYLVFRSGYIPRILGVLLIIGGLGYLMDSATFLVLPSLYVPVFAFLGMAELLFGLWLLIRGVNIEQWEKRALESG